MVRRIISTAVLVASVGAYVLAAERVTFILTNGDRKSGEVAFHGGQGNNLIDGNLNVAHPGDKDETFSMDQVAVIDFAGGQPATTELSQVPASGHFLVMKNGQAQPGEFVNMTQGTTLVWKNASGQTQQIPLSDVSRVYLNPQAARTAFNYSGPAAATVGTAGVQSVPGAITVQASQAWTDAGITVKKGDRVSFATTGQINYGGGQMAGPDGGAQQSPTYPVPALHVGGLIGRVGAGTPFPIGSNSQPIVMPANGRLMLGINDDQIADNTGAFQVVVRKQ